MRCIALLFAVLALRDASLAIDLHSPSGKTRSLSFGFQKVKRNIEGYPKRLLRRDNSVLQLLDNQEYLYYANVSIGTPPQNLRLHLDTGSSDIWVETSKSQLCQSRGDPCASSGTFDSDESSTFEQLSSDFDISYVDGEYARGDYGRDVFRFSDGSVVTGLQFGIGLRSTSNEGIMGIGFDLNEVQVQRLNKAPYRNLVDLMVDQKLIKSRAYSLWLNDLDADTGEILFGGVDTTKYSGKLISVPIDKRAGETNAREFAITLTSVSLTNANKGSLALTGGGFAISILLDSGSTYTYLTPDLAEAIFDQVGAQAVPSLGVAVVPCRVREYDGSIVYSFSGATVSVPLRQLVVDAFDNEDNPATYTDGTPLCYWGILSAGDRGTNVLGDTFLRSAYVVYDLDNEEISLANALYNVTESNILEIGTGRSSVPHASEAPNPVTLAATGTAGTRGNPAPYFTMGVSRSPTATAATSSKSSGSSLKAPSRSRLLILVIFSTSLFISFVL